MYQMESAPCAEAQINGRQMDYFCGTGYYALQANSELIEAACAATRLYGVSSATTRSGFGNNPVLLDVEAKAAQFFDAEAALYYVSGYLGNGILLQGLAPDYDIIFVDEESHYSVMDGAAVAGKPIVTFAYCDVDDLASKLKSHLGDGQRPLVLTDGIFPTSGVIPPLVDYHNLLLGYPGGLLVVDDAHATGVIGSKGQGTLEYLGIAGPGRYSSGTFSKAFGGHGGIITGSHEFIAQLKQRAKVFNGSSATPVSAAAATAKALDVVVAHPEMREQLWAKVAYAKNAFRGLGFTGIPDTPVPIICLSDKRVDLQSIQQALFEKGIATFYVAGGSYSSVPESGALRIAIFSTHSRDQIDRLVSEIGSML